MKGSDKSRDKKGAKSRNYWHNLPQLYRKYNRNSTFGIWKVEGMKI